MLIAMANPYDSGCTNVYDPRTGRWHYTDECNARFVESARKWHAKEPTIVVITTGPADGDRLRAIALITATDETTLYANDAIKFDEPVPRPPELADLNTWRSFQ